MSQIEAALKAFIQQTVSEMGITGGNAGTPQQQPQQQQPQQQQAPADPFGGLGGTPQQQPQQVTAEMIQQVVMPLVANEQTKAKLSAEMNAMGISSLQDVKPEQMAELYQRFCRVRDEANQQPANQQAANTGGGII